MKHEKKSAKRALTSVKTSSADFAAAVSVGVAPGSHPLDKSPLPEYCPKLPVVQGDGVTSSSSWLPYSSRLPEGWSSLHPSAREFLTSLKLSPVHPHCLEDYAGNGLDGSNDIGRRRIRGGGRPKRRRRLGRLSRLAGRRGGKRRSSVRRKNPSRISPKLLWSKRDTSGLEHDASFSSPVAGIPMASASGTSSPLLSSSFLPKTFTAKPPLPSLTIPSPSIQSSSHESSSSYSSTMEETVTLLYQIVPPLLAVINLLARVTAFFVAPASLAYLLADEVEHFVFLHAAVEEDGTEDATDPSSGAATTKLLSFSSTLRSRPNKRSDRRRFKTTPSRTKTSPYRRTSVTLIVVSALGLISSSILLTDSLHVFEHGRTSGAILFASIVLLSFRAWMRRDDRRSIFMILLPAVIVTLACVVDSTESALKDLDRSDNSIKGGWSFPEPMYASASSDSQQPASVNSIDHSFSPPTFHTSVVYAKEPSLGMDLPTIKPGLYYDSSNPVLSSVAALWPEHSRTYDARHGATPWLVSGDGRTLVPFLTNRDTVGRPPLYHRIWVPNEDEGDGEAVALDCAFPTLQEGNKRVESYHNVDMPVYLVLHGLNGGSNTEYVKDFVLRRTADGSTVCVMIARGFMDTPIRGMNTWHVARTSDVSAAAKALKSSLAPGQILAGVGYSVGGITLSNYVARSGKNCHLDAAVSVSGGLDMHQQISNHRSLRIWQPIIAYRLKEGMMGKFRSKYKQRLENNDFKRLMRSTSVMAVDQHGTSKYNGYRDLDHYITEMSAIVAEHDINRLHVDANSRSRETTIKTRRNRRRAPNAERNGDQNKSNPISNVAVPLLVLHALDDPVIGWRAAAGCDGGRGKAAFTDPSQVVRSGNGNVMMLLTKTGGHVGWPLGWNPSREGFRWQSDVIRDFAVTLNDVRKRVRKE